MVYNEIRNCHLYETEETMAEKSAIEKQKILKFIAQVPFSDEDKTRWNADIAENDLSEALLDELHKKLMEIPADKFASDWARVERSTELTRLIKEWRMGLASRHFKRGR